MIITIYCQAASHAHRPWRYEFARAGEGWILCGLPGNLRPKPHSTGGALAGLDGDQRLGYRDWAATQRRRYALRCRICGDNLCLRDDTLKPVLTKLANAGVSEISFHGLRAACSMKGVAAVALS